jgi:hypothetical protein
MMNLKHCDADEKSEMKHIVRKFRAKEHGEFNENLFV